MVSTEQVVFFLHLEVHTCCIHVTYASFKTYYFCLHVDESIKIHMFSELSFGYQRKDSMEVNNTLRVINYVRGLSQIRFFNIQFTFFSQRIH